MYQRKESKEKTYNTTIVSNSMKQNIKEKSGFPSKDVKVRYNINKSAHFQTLACTQKKYEGVRTVANVNGLENNANKAFQSSDTIQMARATIREIEDEKGVGGGTVRSTEGPVVNHKSYPHHAEQEVWNECSQHLIDRLKAGHSERITFIVDTPICPDCRVWFEDTVWNALHNTGGNFSLFVEVGDHTVQITGQDTIWPNEITDSPTWDRMGEYDKMHRFVTEQRNPANGQNEGALTNHVYVGQQQESAIDKQMQYYGDEEKFKTLVKDSLNNAKNGIVRNLFPMYDFADEAAMCNELTSITLLTVMNEAPTLTIPNISDGAYNYDWKKWEQQLTRVFEWWLEIWINDNLQEHEVKKDNPHY